MSKQFKVRGIYQTPNGSLVAHGVDGEWYICRSDTLCAVSNAREPDGTILLFRDYWTVSPSRVLIDQMSKRELEPGEWVYPNK